MNTILGQPVDRVDGRLKVTGKAAYSAEFTPARLCYAVSVLSTLAKGKILDMDVSAAERVPGVLHVMTHLNAMRLYPLEEGGDPGSGKLGEKDLLPLQHNEVFYDGQHIAVVIAERPEQAQHAASLVKVSYAEEKAASEIEQALPTAYRPAKALSGESQVHRGHAMDALKSSTVHIDHTYTTPVYHHNPMEPHATIAEYKEDHLVLYDSTQSVLGSRNAVAKMLGMAPEKVRLISLYIGGGFGCKGFTWPHTVMAAMAAHKVGRPVKLVLDREQMFTCNGHRARTIQRIQLGTGADGKLSALLHDTTTETSFVDEFLETAGIASSVLYACPDASVTHSLVKLNKGTPCPTRAPGEAPGTFAIECAMDELACELHIDPIELRLSNYARVDPQKNLPWSLKKLQECYRRGAKIIGWADRNPQARSMREGRYLVGYGMATAIYPANRSPATVRVKMYPDGRLIAGCCTQDIGTGTYTIVAQVIADELGWPLEKIEVKLGDSLLPKGPNSGGSQTSASVLPAARAAAIELRSKALRLAIADPRSPLSGLAEDSIIASDGRLFLKEDPSRYETYVSLLRRRKLSVLEAEQTTNVSTRKPSSAPVPKDIPIAAVTEDQQVDRKKYSLFSFGAQFVKVLVDPDLGTVKVTHCVSVMDVGKVLNLKTARNQIMGGVIFALGMALMEGTVYDPDGRVVTKSLADYLVPVHADMPDFTVAFIDEPDPIISPIGSRGIGEIGITGMAAAVANAVYHATGKRVRDLPITPDKLIG